MSMPIRWEDIPYYQERAEQEIQLAQRAEHPRAVRAHYEIAGFYLDLVHNSPGAPPRPRNALQN